MFNVECSMLSEATIQHSKLNIRNFLSRYPTMQIFSGAMAAAIRRTGTQAEHVTPRWREGPQASDHLLRY
jgi:hypothetical protein